MGWWLYEREFKMVCLTGFEPAVAKAMAGRPAKARRLSAETLVKAGLSKNILISVAALRVMAGRPAKE